MSANSKLDFNEEEIWFIVIGSQTRGPLSVRDLDVLMRTNGINSRTYAWKQGMKQWKFLNEIQQLRDSILESSKQILEIQKKREGLFDKGVQENVQKVDGEQEADQTIENKDENPLAVLQATVENLLKKSFHQNVDGKWNVYDEQKKQWIEQSEEPKEQIEKMKQLLFNKLKNELFFDDKNNRRKKVIPEQPEKPLTQQQLIRKQKNKKKAKRQAEKKKEKWYNARINTFIYVSGLPLDITEEQLKDFASKAGVIRIDLNTGKQKIKIYKDENGLPKGDAAISYVRQESVDIAVENLNNNEVRSGFYVHVQKAKFNQKQEEYKPRQTKKQTMVKKIQAKMLQKKQFGWDQDNQQQGASLKIVILKQILDYNQISNEQYLEAVKKDISQQISKIGQIQRIKFYETHPEGIVEVKFKHQKDAEQCISIMNGRFFDQRMIECDYWDGQTNYKHDAQSLILQKQRLQKYGLQLQGNDEKLQKQQQNFAQIVQGKPEEEDEQQINKHLLQDN